MKQFITHIKGHDASYRDIIIKHDGIVKVKSIKRIAQDAGIVHDLSASVEVIKGTMRVFQQVDLINISRKEIV